MSEKIRVAVVDDHPKLREGLVRTLSDQGDIDIVGEGASADQAVEIARQLSPDVILLDMNIQARDSPPLRKSRKLALPFESSA